MKLLFALISLGLGAYAVAETKEAIDHATEVMRAAPY